MLYIKELLGINCKDVTRFGLITSVFGIAFAIQSFCFESWFSIHQLLKAILIVLVITFVIGWIIEISSWKYN